MNDAELNTAQCRVVTEGESFRSRPASAACPDL